MRALFLLGTALTLAACGRSDADGTQTTASPTGSDPTTPAPTTPTAGDDDDDDDITTPLTDTGTPPTDPFTPFVGTLTVVVDGEVLGDGSSLALGEPTVGFDPVTTALVLSNPTDAAIALPGDADSWLTGDDRLTFDVPPPAELAPGATAEVVLALHPDHEGPVAATLTLPAADPVALELVGRVHGPLPTVIVGRLGRTLVSWDYGLTWDDRQEITDPYVSEWGHDSNFNDITWGDGRFVAVGGNGTERIAWSVDGTAWTDVGDPDRGSLSTVCFGRLADGTPRYVATSGNDLVWSADGESWILESHPGWEGLSALAFGGDRWVGVGGWRGVTLDGQTWLSELDGDDLSDVVYAEGRFVAVGNGGRVAWSVDGIDWTEQVIASDTNFGRVAYGGGQFVTGGWPAGQFVSDDGETWVHHDGNEDIAPLGYSNGRFVGSTWVDKLWHSPDGVQWTLAQDNSEPQWAGYTELAAALPESP